MKMKTESLPMIWFSVTVLVIMIHLSTIVADDSLGEKLAKLEAKIEQQEILLTVLKKGRKPLKENFDIIQQHRHNATFRTCHEIHLANPSLNSGMYWIDPDGQGISDPAINVFCNISSGTTFVLHDSESEMDVGQCTESGCYSRGIKYYASDRQIAALVELSEDCAQLIRYDCHNAPLTFEDVAFSWYNDNNGKKKFFSGWLTDCDTLGKTYVYGTIPFKGVLPIRHLNFRGTDKGYGKYTLSRLQCKGKVEIKHMPSSCEDLWRIGHTLNGLYSVMGVKSTESVYCDFSKRPNEKDFQKWIGYNDVKSTPVYFYVSRNLSFSLTSQPIPFHLARINVGNAMNLTSGKFTAPRPGIYFFSFTGVAAFPPVTADKWVYLGVGLYLNGNYVGRGQTEEANTVKNQYSSLALQSMLSLSPGDQVWLQLVVKSPNTVLHDDNDNDGHWTHFCGWMLEESVAQSL